VTEKGNRNFGAEKVMGKEANYLIAENHIVKERLAERGGKDGTPFATKETFSWILRGWRVRCVTLKKERQLKTVGNIIQQSAILFRGRAASGQGRGTSECKQGTRLREGYGANDSEKVPMQRGRKIEISYSG